MDAEIELDKCRQGIKWMGTKLTRYKDVFFEMIREIEMPRDWFRCVFVILRA